MAGSLLRCTDCGLQNICFPPAFDDSALNRISEVIGQPPLLRQGQVLYQIGEAHHAIYAIRSGSIKTSIIQHDGSELITGFYQPGEVVGLENLGHAVCTSRAEALEKTSLCVLPTDQLTSLSRQLPELQQHIFQLMSTEIRADHQRLHLIGARSVEARLASFLYGWVQRLQHRKLTGSSFRLPMARADLANHLGVAVETVSRSFSRLEQLGVLQVSGKAVHIHDSAQLLLMANAQCA